MASESWSGVTDQAYRRGRARLTAIRHPDSGAGRSARVAFVRTRAPVAQGIEHRPPEAGAQVRILPGARHAATARLERVPREPSTTLGVDSGSSAAVLAHRGSSLVTYSPMRALEEAKLAVPESTEDSSMSGFGANEWLVDEMYEKYQKDPDSVDKVWWDFFGKGPRKASASSSQLLQPRRGSSNGSGGTTGTVTESTGAPKSRPAAETRRRTTRPARRRATRRRRSPGPGDKKDDEQGQGRASREQDQEPTTSRPHKSSEKKDDKKQDGAKKPTSKSTASRAPARTTRPRTTRTARRTSRRRRPRRSRSYTVLKGAPARTVAEHGRQPHRARPRPASARCRSSCSGTTASSSTTTSPAPAAARCRSPTSSATRWSRR